MTRDYPMLTPVFFTEALDAGDEFFKALDYAEDKAEAHEKAPDTEPKLTQREFRSVIYEKPPAASRTLDDRRRSSTSGSQTGSGEDPSPAGEPNPQPPFSEPQAPEPDNSSTDIDAEAEPQTVESALERARELAEEEGIDLQEAVTHAFGIELGSEEEASTDGPESPDDQVKPDELTCFECSGCRMLKADQRLAVVKPSGEVLMQFEPTAVWACGRHNRVISVRAQNFVHARAIAAACPDLDPVSAGEQQTAAEDDNLAASEESVSLDDVMAAQEAIVS